MRWRDRQPAALRASSLASALSSLTVRIESARVAVLPVDVPSYPDGPRPSSIVTLSGGGYAGRGEHVGWTIAAHESFRERVAWLASPRDTTLAVLSNELEALAPEPYDRAALEAAAIDLTLRQAGTDLFGLLGVAPEAVRYVVSTEPRADPLAFIRDERAAQASLQFKLDVDPDWDERTYRELAASGAVAVLDWKLSGDTDAHERAHHHLPDALLEDPKPGPKAWSATLLERLSLDAALTSARSLDDWQGPAPAAANIKPARLGGVLEAIETIALCAERGIDVYFGGMFEIGIGRRQLLALASLLSPDGPNDIAPITLAGQAKLRPPRLVAASGTPGFG